MQQWLLIWEGKVKSEIVSESCYIMGLIKIIHYEMNRPKQVYQIDST